MSGKNVVDLGCGLGLTSIAAAMAGARTVWATDGDGKLLEKTEENLRRNAGDHCDDDSLRTAKLYWYGVSSTRDPLHRMHVFAVIPITDRCTLHSRRPCWLAMAAAVTG